MIRFIKNILDIKNILGMNRVSPISPHDPEALFMHSNDGMFTVTPYWNGTIHVQNYQEQYDLDESHSGEAITFGDSEDIVAQGIIFGDVYTLDIADDQKISHIAVSKYLEYFIINGYVRLADLRNGDALNRVVIRNNTNDIVELYAIANNETQRDICVRILNTSPYEGTLATLWINAAQPYAADVIAAATAKGWTINYL